MNLVFLREIGKDRLNRLLRDDETALDQYVRYQLIEAHLAWRFAPVAGSGEQSPEAASVVSGESKSEASRSRYRPQFRRWLLAVAAVLAGVFVGYPLGHFTQKGSHEKPIGQVNQHATIARLTFSSPDVRWEGGRPVEVGAAFEKGWINLDAGTIELTFISGATVRIDGPALFAIDSPLRGFLSYGKVRAHAPADARDFAVGTAAMEVVDLGTEFDLSISQQSGAAKIDVLEGLVDLHLFNAGGGNRIQSLSTGQSAGVDGSGKITEIKGDKLDPRLLAHWRLDDDAETTLVLDASPNQFHGTLNVPTRERTQKGKIGGAFALRSDGYVDFSKHLKALTSTNALPHGCAMPTTSSFPCRMALLNSAFSSSSTDRAFIMAGNKAIISIGFRPVCRAGSLIAGIMSPFRSAAAT